METKTFLKNKINSEMPYPSVDWVDSTRNLLIEAEQNEKNNVTKSKTPRISSLINLFFSSFYMKKSSLALLAFGGVLTISAIAGGGFYYFNNQNKSVEVALRTFSESEKLAIYENIAKNNTQSSLKPQSTLENSSKMASNESASTTFGGDTMPSLLPYYPVVERNYTFSKTLTNQQSGPRATECKMISSNGLYANSTTEVFDFMDNNGIASSKSITKDFSGNLLNYSISKSTTGSSDYVYYMGGNYGIRSVYTYPADAILPATNELEISDSSELSIEPNYGFEDPTLNPVDYLKMLYGENMDLIGETTTNGRDSYVIRYSYETDCNADFSILPYSTTERSMFAPSANYTPDNRTIFVDVIVDKQTYLAFENIQYLDGVDASNIVSKYSVDAEYSNSEYAAVSRNFEFSTDFPNIALREEFVSPSTYDSNVYATQVVDSLDRDTGFVFIPTNGFVLSYLNQYTEADYGVLGNYWADRNFYAPTSFGEQLYLESNSFSDLNFPTVLTNMSFGPEVLNGNSIDFSIYKKTDSVADVVQSIVGDNASTATSSIVLNIDGATYNATQYAVEYSYSEPVLLEGDASSSFMPSVSGYNFTIFEYNGFVVAINQFENYASIPVVNNLSISTSTVGQSAYTEVRNRAFGILNGTIQVSYDYGTIEPAIEPDMLR